MFDLIIIFVGSVIFIVMDVRIKSEVKNDVEIDVVIMKCLLENKGDELKGVFVLVFVQYVVLVGLVRSVDAKCKVVKMVGKDKRIWSL